MKLNLLKVHFVYLNRFSHQARQGMPVEELKRATPCGSCAIVVCDVSHYYPMRL